jgi:hypothetical protein
MEIIMKRTQTNNRKDAKKHIVYVETIIEREVSVMAVDIEEAKEIAINRLKRNKGAWLYKYKILEHEVIDVEPE